MMKDKLLLLLLVFSFSYAQPERLYTICQTEYSPRMNTIKVKVPNWLKTHQVMEQIRLVLTWPEQPLPDKPTRIYVFKETDREGSTSSNGCLFLPGEGFFWDLKNWHPDSIHFQYPTAEEIRIYNRYLDEFFQNEFTLSDTEIKKNVAKEFNLTATDIDSIYLKIRYWRYKTGHSRLGIVKFPDPADKK